MSSVIDTHAHINDKAFASEVAEVIDRAVQAGVLGIVVVGYDLTSSGHAVQLAEEYQPLWAAVGVHPHDAPQATASGLMRVSELATCPKVVAIGEIGLDYYWNTWPKEQQRRSFSLQIQLAKDLKLPFIVHDRDAHGEVLKVLREHQPYPQGFVMHCFSGSLEFAEDCMRLGGYISLAGPVTFRNAAKVLDVARGVPLDRLLVETDCPYLAPHPHRGQRNEPAYVQLVVSAISKLRDIPVEQIAHQTSRNAQDLFKFKERV